MKLLVTGANGFLGKHLLARLALEDYNIIPVSRLNLPSKAIQPDTDWQGYLQKVDIIIHLAALVHSTALSHLTLDNYRFTNTLATLNLAQQAAQSGVRRFIFLSTIKVNGEENHLPYTEKSPPNPRDPYAQSKWEAEQGLREISTKTGMEVVIIRPPLVYGASVKANFLKLLQWVDTDLPLPLASIDNKRSLIFVRNLADFIKCCIEHPKAANQTFLVSDGKDLSTSDLIKRIAKNFNKQSRAFPFPPTPLRLALRLIGKQAEAQRLLGSLTLDPTFAYQTLDWTPPFTMDEGLAETINAYKDHK